MVETDCIAPKEIDVSACNVNNGGGNLTITNVAPAAVGVSSIAKWLKVRREGVDYYIPMWT